MVLNKWFDKGMTPENYISTMDKLKKGHTAIYNNFNLSNDEVFLNSLKNKDLRVIILAEVWCSHCMLNIPILLHLAEKTDMPVRILPRDENLELMDQYLTNGNRTIPIFIFIDEDGNEVTKWGPMAETTRDFVSPYREKLPSKDDEDYQEKFTEMVKFTTKSFYTDPNLWAGVYNSLKETLESI